MRLESRPEPATFTWIAEPIDQTLVISFRGELDLAVIDECRDGLAEPLTGPERIVLFDLGGVTFADSTGLRLLIDVKRRADADGKRLLLTRVSAPILKLFEMTGLTSWFDYLEGHAPPLIDCPLCDGRIVPDSRRCPRCGCAL